MYERKRILIILPNHELQPRLDSPGISHIIHNTLINCRRHDYETFSIKSSESGLRLTPSYVAKLCPKMVLDFVTVLLSILPSKVRKRIFGIAGVRKCSRAVICQLYSLLNARKYDVIIFHNYIDLIRVAALIRIVSSTKIIYYFHGSGLESIYSNYLKLLNRLDGLITISNEPLTSVDIQHCNIINNYSRKHGINAPNENEERELDNKYQYFLSTSNIDRNKNLSHVIALFLESSLTGELHLYGKIIDQAYFEEEIYPLLSNAKGRIKYFGSYNHADLLKILPRYSYVFQLSLNMEGNSMSVIEAMVQGKVIPIVSNVGGLPEIVMNGRYGLVLDLAETFTNQLKSLANFMRSTERLNQIRARIETEIEDRFSPNESATNLEGFINRILS